MINLLIMISNEEISTRADALSREPGKLQTGLGAFRKMVLEEPLLSVQLIKDGCRKGAA